MSRRRRWQRRPGTWPRREDRPAHHASGQAAPESARRSRRVAARQWIAWRPDHNRRGRDSLRSRRSASERPRLFHHPSTCHPSVCDGSSPLESETDLVSRRRSMNKSEKALGRKRRCVFVASTASKKPPPCRGFSVRRSGTRSVLPERPARAEHPAGAELVVHPDQADIDVLVDAMGHGGETGGGDKVEILVAYEQMVVFDADRPVRSEGIFQTCPDRTAPA